MGHGSVWIISPIIAIGLSTSAAAQGVDQNTKQQIEQIIAAYHDAWNNHNAAGVAALYTKDGILVTQASQIVKHGQQDRPLGNPGVPLDRGFFVQGPFPIPDSAASARALPKL